MDTELAIINSMDLGTKAQELYKWKYDSPDDDVSKRCIDFKAMEQLAVKYGKEENKDEG